MSINAPHDGLFKKIYSEKLAAKQLLEHYLAPTLLKQLNLTKITIEKESYVEPNLKKQLSDIVYSVDTKNNEKAFVYILLEHQITSDYWMAFRLWKYVLLLCDRHKDEKKNKLPLVIPIVIYNGKEKYLAPKNLWELFENIKLAKQILTSDYSLIDLQAMKDNDIKKVSHLGMVIFMMKHIHDRDMVKLWKNVLTIFKPATLIDQKLGYIYLQHLIWYTDPKTTESQSSKIEKLIYKHLGETNMGGFAEKYLKPVYEEGIEKGREEGIEKGREEGIEKGREEGIEKEKISTAAKLLAKGLDFKLIEDVTGFSRQELLKLKNHIKA